MMMTIVMVTLMMTIVMVTSINKDCYGDFDDDDRDDDSDKRNCSNQSCQAGSLLLQESPS